MTRQEKESGPLYQMLFVPPEGRREALWVEHFRESQYKVLSAPVWCYGVSIGTLVEGSQSERDSFLKFRRIVKESPGGTMRVIVPSGGTQASEIYLKRIIPDARRLGFNIGPATFFNPRLVSIHIHDRSLWWPTIGSYLDALVKEGVLEGWEVGDPDQYADEYTGKDEGINLSEKILISAGSPEKFMSYRLRLLILLCAIGACDSNPAKNVNRDETKDAVGKTVQDSVTARLKQFLKASFISSKEDPMHFMSCTPDGQTDVYYALAKFRILDSQVKQDTAYAAVEIVSVAEENPSSVAINRYSTSFRIKTDTLHWAMTRDSVTHQWGVCGYPVEGIGLGRVGGDEETDWIPKGMTWRKVFSVIDSISKN